MGCPAGSLISMRRRSHEPCGHSACLYLQETDGYAVRAEHRLGHLSLRRSLGPDEQSDRGNAGLRQVSRLFARRFDDRFYEHGAPGQRIGQGPAVRGESRRRKQAISDRRFRLQCRQCPLGRRLDAAVPVADPRDDPALQRVAFGRFGARDYFRSARSERILGGGRARRGRNDYARLAHRTIRRESVGRRD